MILSYSKIVEIAKELIDNENIPTEGLTITYSIPQKLHRKLDEDLFYRINDKKTEFEPSDVIEIEVGTIKFKIAIEKNSPENLDNQE
jgi:hypothetical protein